MSGGGGGGNAARAAQIRQLELEEFRRQAVLTRFSRGRSGPLANLPKRDIEPPPALDTLIFPDQGSGERSLDVLTRSPSAVSGSRISSTLITSHRGFGQRRPSRVRPEDVARLLANARELRRLGPGARDRFAGRLRGLT